MPQEVISLRHFGGQVTNPHQEDIPDNMGVVVTDVDPHLESGVLRGIETEGSNYTANGTVIPDVTYSDWIKYTRGDLTDLGISTVTNASPIVVTTSSAHHLVTGDKVVITEVVPSGVNGTYRITVPPDSTTTFELDGSTAQGAYVSGGKVNYTGGEKWDLIYIDKDDNDVTAIEDFYNSSNTYRTLNDVESSPDGTLKCIKTFNSQVQIGQSTTNDKPIVIHRLLRNKSFFNNGETVLAGLYAEDGTCENLGTSPGGVSCAINTALNGGGTGFFQANILYAWAVSYVYDNLQESDLYINSYSCSSSNAAVSSEAVIDITVDGADSDITVMDRRVTGVKLYRAESSDTNKANMGLFRYIDEIGINGSWTGDDTDYTYAYTDDGKSAGATYEEETGISETLDKTFVSYQLNEVGGGYHWMANVHDIKNESADIDWSKHIFRSKKFRPNMCDWSNDFIVLPEIPVEIKYYNDKLYAFTENKVYRMNPELLSIEDVFEGAGVSARDGVVGTEYGMFFCNKEGAYVLKNNQINPISDAISKPPTGISGTYAYSWDELADNAYSSGFQRIIVRYVTAKRMVLFMGANSGNQTTGYGYYLPTGQWYHLTLGAQTVASDSGMFTGKDGEVYLSDDDNTNQIFGTSDTFQTCHYVTREFHLGEPSQNKSWNKITWDGTATVKYATEGSDPTSGTTATSGSWINTYKKTFQVYISVTTGNSVDSLDIVARRLYGKR